MMKITVSNLRPVSSGLTTTSEKADDSKKTTTTAKIAESGSIISEAQQSLRQMPEVDEARVAEMKQAIASGELTPDSEKLARSMMDYFRR